MSEAKNMGAHLGELEMYKAPHYLWEQVKVLE